MDATASKESWMCSDISELTSGSFLDESFSSSSASSLGETSGSKQQRHRRFPTLLPATVFGRDKEKIVFREVWERVSSKSVDHSLSPSEVINLSGPSGVGKSFLLDTVVRKLVEPENGIYVSSKFDQFSLRREPFYAIVAALSDVCEILACAADDDEASTKTHQIAKQLVEALHEDIALFCQFVPTMTPLLLKANLPGEYDDGRSEELPTESFPLARLQRACKSFISCVSRHRPLCLVLDDIQWADEESVRLLRGFLGDPDSQNVCFVLSAREDDPATASIASSLGLSNCTSDITSATAGNNKVQLPVTELKLCNLNEREVGQMLSGLLDGNKEHHNGSSNEETATLTKMVFAKTRGNALFVVQFMEMMRTEGILTYSNQALRWNWKFQDKMARLDVSEDVCKSIDARVHALNATTRFGLMIAAHLGFRFRMDVFETVMSALYRKTYRHGNEASLRRRFERILETAEKESMLFRTNNDKNELCFLHDRIQQCLYEMTPDGEPRQRLCLAIGRQLRGMASDEDPSLTFFVADMLNKGKDYVVKVDEIFSVVKLNQDASKLSVKKSSYSSATHYLRNAVCLLDGCPAWSSNYELTLKIWSWYAWCACHAGEHEDCENAVNNVVGHARNALDKKRVYQARLRALEMQGRNREAVAFGLAVLSELGSPMKAKPLKASLVFQIFRIRRKLNRLTDEDLLSLRKVEEGSYKAAALDILQTMSIALIMSNDTSLILQSGLRMLDLSLDYGWSASTPYGVANFGTVETAVFRNFRKAARYAKLATEMVARFNLPASECQVTALTQFVTFPWLESWSRSVDPLFRGFQNGLKNGEIFHACMCLGMACPMLFYSMSLPVVEKKISFMVKTQLQLQGRAIHVHFTEPYWQYCLNLLGRSEDVLELNGDAMNEEDFLASDIQSTFVVGYYLKKLELACFFRSPLQAQKYVGLVEKEQKLSVELCCPQFVFLEFFSALAYHDLARKQNNKKQYLRKAKASVRRLSQTVKKGCIDAKPFLSVLLADLVGLKGASSSTKSICCEFNKAIEESLEHGFLGIAALACERASFALRERDAYRGEASSGSYWYRAIELYTEWEAHGKVEWMQRHTELCMEGVMIESCRPVAEVGVEGDVNLETRHAQ